MKFKQDSPEWHIQSRIDSLESLAKAHDADVVRSTQRLIDTLEELKKFRDALEKMTKT